MTSSSVEEIIYQPDAHSPTEQTMIAQGDLEQWKASVVAPLKGLHYPLAFLAAAFAAPLLKFAHAGSFGLHLYGRSTEGKTTTLQVAASVWGCGAKPNDAPSKAFIRGWYSTANALEGLCAAHMDCLMVLDELQMCEAKAFGNVVYTLFGGQGKAAMNTNRQLKAQRQWRLVLLSSGEISAVQKIQDNGDTVRAGQQVRLLDVPIVGRIFDNAAAADAVNTACSSCYGVAGPAFIQCLVNEYDSLDALQADLRSALDAAVATMPRALSKEQERGLRHLALIKVAGQMACTLLDLPLEISDFDEAIDHVASAWLNNTATLPDIERAILAIRDFILKHRDSRFRTLPSDERTHVANVAGYWNYTEHFYAFTPDGFKEACTGFEYRDVAKELRTRGFLKHDAQKLTTKVKCLNVTDLNAPTDGRINVYKVMDSILEAEDPA
jgi:putative DNA primase/helicase